MQVKKYGQKIHLGGEWQSRFVFTLTLSACCLFFNNYEEKCHKKSQNRVISTTMFKNLEKRFSPVKKRKKMVFVIFFDLFRK
ncbi:hypothetical protein GE061_007818 [Apolygus lucorum]|uniref:Uncharacterized protein n=1 Tax=Apolygus lucorum TaxID=248454 RepID=A0A8S9WMH1_APOLU|nr:hypothetical protein GE061_007818 [Apolygus lucorum]